MHIQHNSTKNTGGLALAKLPVFINSAKIAPFLKIVFKLEGRHFL